MTLEPNWVIVVLTAVLAIVAYLQWRTYRHQAKIMGQQAQLMDAGLVETRKAAEAARAGAEAAASSAKTAREALELTQCGHLGFGSWSITIFEPNKAPRIVFDLHNSGPTRIDIIDSVEKYSFTNDVPNEVDYAGKVGIGGWSIAPSGTIRRSLDHDFILPISADVFAALVSGVVTFYLWGRFRYRDVFGREHTTGFGVRFKPETKEFPFINKPGYNYTKRLET